MSTGGEAEAASARRCSLRAGLPCAPCRPSLHQVSAGAGSWPSAQSAPRPRFQPRVPAPLSPLRQPGLVGRGLGSGVRCLAFAVASWGGRKRARKLWVPKSEGCLWVVCLGLCLSLPTSPFGFYFFLFYFFFSHPLVSNDTWPCPKPSPLLA